MAKKITITAEFGIGQTVYLKTDPEQNERMVKAITVYSNCHTYTLCSGTESSEHDEIEIIPERKVI